MAKIISIVGPTAVGKTDFAFQAANMLGQLGSAGIDIISADSRQVYQGLNIISGADIPSDFEARQVATWRTLPGYFEKDRIRLFGLGLLAPTDDWSVSQFQNYARRVMELSQSENRISIIVGGTGLYQQHVLNDDPQLHIPPNLEVRVQAATMSVTTLQTWLGEVSQSRLTSLNDSDRNNPRRLIRAIEIGLAQNQLPPAQTRPTAFSTQSVTIGLTDSIEAIAERINQRVASRLAAGALAEVERLLAEYPNQKLPLYSATGVKPLVMLANGVISLEECEEVWSRQERQYAKRQLTWWKKQSNVTWFRIHEPDWQTPALEQIKTWWEA